VSDTWPGLEGERGVHLRRSPGEAVSRRQ